MDEVSEINEAIESAGEEQINGRNLTLANRWKRLGGAIIDSLISGIIGFIFMVKMGIFKRLLEGIQMTITEQVYLFVIGWVAFLILQGYLLFKRGQTIGKIMVKTKIVDKNGNVPNFGKLLILRYFVFGLFAQIPIVGGLFNLANVLFIFGEEHHCLHDYLAGTYVINESEFDS
ncbi:MAG: RDD family protein [Sedimentisphaerales bacterium]|nr:RDD family protein [Sedimentisphaerales bacterium]